MISQSQVITLLTASLVRPFALAAAAWLILRIFKVRHPSSRHAVWTVVLIGMLLLPAMSILAPHWKLPVLPGRQDTALQTAAPASPAITQYDAMDFAAPITTTSQHAAAPQTRVTAEVVIVWCYLAGLFAMLAYRLIGSALLWRVIFRSRSLRTTRVRESDDVLTPVAVGVLRPSVLLPAEWRNWNAGTRRAVLAHEFAHLRRRDTLIASIARLAKCVFWFHPLAWWISRQLSDLAELSCDAAALRKIDDPVRYSKILLGFADTIHRAGHRATLPGLAMASRSGMGHRIDQIFEVAGGNMQKLSRPGIVLAVLGLPVMCLAATLGLTTTKIKSQPQPAIVRETTPAFAPAAPLQLAQAQPAPKALPSPASAPQPAPAPKPKFDVVSIKPCLPGSAISGRGGAGTARAPSNGMGGYFSRSPGRLNISCGSIMSMVNISYVMNGDPLLNSNNSPTITQQQMKGVPDWAVSARYTIEAETDDPVANGDTDTPNSPAWKLMVGPMLQSLLEDRFHLKLRRDTEEVPMYNLVVAKGGFKLKPMQEGECQQPETGPGGRGTMIRKLEQNDKPYCHWMGGDPHGPNRTVLGGGVPVNRLADFLSTFIVDRHVIDKTGLDTVVNIHLEFAPDENTPCDGPPARCTVDNTTDIPPGPTIFTALEQQLGLKLEPTKAPQGYIAIEHVEPPSEN